MIPRVDQLRAGREEGRRRYLNNLAGLCDVLRKKLLEDATFVPRLDPIFKKALAGQEEFQRVVQNCRQRHAPIPGKGMTAGQIVSSIIEDEKLKRICETKKGRR